MMLQQTASILFNQEIATKTWQIRLDCPEIAKSIRPGQFVMLKIPHRTDPLLGRPFALYDVAGNMRREPEIVEIVYLVVGKMTSMLSEMRVGELIEIWGPLGNGFYDLGEQENVNLVAGGIGQTPFLAYAKQLLGQAGYANDLPKQTAQKVTLFYGARSADYLAGLDDFWGVGVKVKVATDDGSQGFRGRITDLLAQDFPQGPVIGCGPEPMLYALAKLCKERGRECHVSLETPMACGFGACFSCVTKVQTRLGWDYKRVCVEGPVFNAAQLDWSDS